MAEIQLGVVEAHFADIIWEHEPVTSTELVKLAADALSWKRTTTHTVLRRLCDKGLFLNDKGTVTKSMRRLFWVCFGRAFICLPGLTMRPGAMCWRMSGRT